MGVQRVVRLLTAAVLVAAASVALSASPASASCIAPPSVEESITSSDLVFVGTVVELNNRNRWATFTIDEIWKGEPGSSRVEVRGGPPGGQATSVDRAFEPDKQYLVFATRGDRHWEDNACSATRLYDETLAGFRPAGASTVDRATSDEGDGGLRPGTVVFAGVVLLVAVGGFLVVRRWGRNAGTPA